MPLYEYQCSCCGSRFELLRPLSRAGENVPCPACRGQAEKVVSRCAVFTKDSSGATVPVGGSSCAGCRATSCSSCNS